MNFNFIHNFDWKQLQVSYPFCMYVITHSFQSTLKFQHLMIIIQHKLVAYHIVLPLIKSLRNSIDHFNLSNYLIFRTSSTFVVVKGPRANQLWSLHKRKSQYYISFLAFKYPRGNRSLFFVALESTMSNFLLALSSP
jgi:hypothetical protein